MLLSGLLSTPAWADPVLPDWTAATFGPGSDVSENRYYPLQPGTLSIYEGMVDGTLERIETFVTFQTIDILGVRSRVIRDRTYEDGLLVEVARDWYAEDNDGNVWYFGEFVINYNYDDDGNLIGTNNHGSWVADGITNLPGIIMPADPQVGDSYYQEFAPDVALDFAVVNSLDAIVNIDFGNFTDVLHTSEGNLFDGPEIVEHKLYALDIGLVLIQELDDAGEVAFEIPLIDRYMVPGPGSASVIASLAMLGSRRRIRR
ncbi:MAG: hypothetical protein DYG94_13515 [Leptolyngbya sp. PLA3]|nr:MAG: hypothetical protein EDM82_14070 [Cyanobacteria bacterium CYA]MCE7969744.1 hypothetical protein [Leptolyngbya sp. PL-A3]